MNAGAYFVLGAVGLGLLVGRAVRLPYTRPLATWFVTSGYSLDRVHPVTGERRPHNGVDLRAPVGTPVYCPADGVCTASVGDHGGHTATLVLNAPLSPFGVTRLRFMHLDGPPVTGLVQEGEVIARTGASGRVTGPHLHLETWAEGKLVDPSKVFS